jgi:uncharacterized protein (DUF433 family)
MTPRASKSQGIYDVPSAARYLLAAREAAEVYPVSSRSLIRWIRKGLALPELSDVPGRELMIAFQDLVSMRVIAALRAAGVSWNDIDNAERWLRDNTHHSRPFATEELWTSRSSIFTRFRRMLISASRHGQLAMELLTHQLIPISGLRFEDNIARTWEPRPLILLDPKVQFGAPCIKGTRIPTRSVWGMIEAGDPRELVLGAYRIIDDELDAALRWEASLAAA